MISVEKAKDQAAKKAEKAKLKEKNVKVDETKNEGDGWTVK